MSIYGDGSFTSPTVWWAALGGFDIWVPKWSVEQVQEGPKEVTGQTKRPRDLLSRLKLSSRTRHSKTKAVAVVVKLIGKGLNPGNV